MLGALAVAFAVQAAAGIGPVNADTLSSQAVAESLQVLATLDERVRSYPRDTAAWHRRAMVAFALSERSSRPPAPPALNYNALRRVADVSFQTAIALAPEDVRLRLDAGTFYLMSDWTVTRTVSYIHFDEALKLARARNDSAGLVNALVDAGRIYWRRYDSFANRALNNILPTHFEDTVGFGTSIRRIRGGAVQIMPDVGEADFLRAQAMFREAYDLAPRDPRTYSQYAMLLTEGKRWSELPRWLATGGGGGPMIRGDSWRSDSRCIVGAKAARRAPRLTPPSPGLDPPSWAGSIALNV